MSAELGTRNPERTAEPHRSRTRTTFTFTFFILLTLGACTLLDEGRVQPPLLAPTPAHPNLKLAFKYHGIRTCTIDETGTWFERDGKRVKLWTDGCRKYVQRNQNRQHVIPVHQNVIPAKAGIQATRSAHETTPFALAALPRGDRRDLRDHE